jgi:ABC-type Fe3+ transport system permease subunit
LPVREQVLTKETLCIGSIFCFNVLALQFYLGNARWELKDLGDKRGEYARMFGYIIPGVLLAAGKIVVYARPKLCD